MINVQFLPELPQGFYTVDCSEVASAFYAPSIQALIAYLRKLGYRSSKLTVLVGVIALGQRNNAHDVARFVRPIRVSDVDRVNAESINAHQGISIIRQLLLAQFA